MKNKISILTLFILSITKGYGQMKDFYGGVSFSSHNEIGSRMIYGSRYSDENKLTHSFGAGIRVQEKFSKTWGYTIGLNYVKRQYNISVPYDHCFDLPPEYACTHNMTWARTFGYKTVELPLGISKYLITKNKFELYTNLTGTICYNYQSFYGAVKNNKINLFSSAVTSNIGFSYNPHKNLKLIVEPFIRMLYKQQVDPILLWRPEHQWAYFDNFGANLLLMYKL